MQSASLRHTVLQPPTLTLENGDCAENATAAVVMTNARKNIHIERFIVDLLFFVVGITPFKNQDLSPASGMLHAGHDFLST